jgi:hypothetical protein
MHGLCTSPSLDQQLPIVRHLIIDLLFRQLCGFVDCFGCFDEEDDDDDDTCLDHLCCF